MKYSVIATYLLLNVNAIGQNPTASSLRFYSNHQSHTKSNDTLFACNNELFEGVFCKSAEINQAKILDTVYSSIDSMLFNGVLIDCVLKGDSPSQNMSSQVICNYVNGRLDTSKTIFFKHADQDPENFISTDSSKGYFFQINYSINSKNVGFLFNESGCLHTKYIKYKLGDTLVSKRYHYSASGGNAMIIFNYSTRNARIDTSYAFERDTLVYDLIRTYKTSTRAIYDHHRKYQPLIDIGSENVIFLNRFNRPISEAKFLRNLNRRTSYTDSEFAIPLENQTNSNGYQVILYINYKISRSPYKKSIDTILFRHKKWLHKNVN
jgi:hypothetical protein